MRTIASLQNGCMEKICTGRSGASSGYGHSTVGIGSMAAKAYSIEPAYDDKTLFRLDVWITTGAAGRWDHSVVPASGVGAFIPLSMSGGQITP
jgi:hypothetical protein